MKTYKRNFLELAMKLGVLKFGEFTLKSGRKSPYFFNAGLFNTGQSVADLGQYYANTIVDSGIEFDMIFGPAYKGIPLATISAAALAEHHQINKPFSYNRKESKQHGEGGVIVGAPLNGKVLIIDDVITAGTAVKEAFNLIENSNAKIAGLIISLDRQEIGVSGKSAIQELEDNLNIPVVSIAKLDDLIELIKISDDLKVHLSSIIKYQEQFGITV
ncbi:MAG: orotate phosphoribosyltransferase [Woeseiaceae bacterium]|jgi:orotate phosphoribosyltransferase|nr:orotate phosphoribosyltransferase [Woeseiaceae bacterium]|tara:strand:- start:5717 stop:6364 length:648 start_codon:yes stop_codon:yes gene_type:complete